MRTLGLDLGSKRIGVAVSDPLGFTAQGLATLRPEGGEQGVIRELRAVIEDKDVKEIVVGLPINMNGTEGPQAKAAIQFADTLKNEFSMPVKLWDERLSTVEVEKVMIMGGASRKKRKNKIDTLAAQVMLQSYLNSKQNDIRT